MCYCFSRTGYWAAFSSMRALKYEAYSSLVQLYDPTETGSESLVGTSTGHKEELTWYWQDSTLHTPCSPLSVFPRRCNPDSYTDIYDCLIRVMANWTRGVLEWWAAVFFFFLALLSEEEGACRFNGILRHIILHFPSVTSPGSSWVFLHLTCGNIRLHLWYALYSIKSKREKS